MGLNSLVIKSGASAMTPTGGTDQTFTPDGVSIPNGIHLADAAQTDFRIRGNLTIKTKQPTLNTATNEYSKDRKTMTFVQPKILASGKVIFNLIRVEREVHPESTAAEALELLMKAAQFCADPDAASYWSTGSLA